MLAFVARRVLATVPVLAMVAIFVFLMLRLTPGDPAAIIAGDNASAAQIAEIRDRLGLARPILERFAIWAGNLLRSDPGNSFFLKAEVTELIGQRVGRLLDRPAGAVRGVSVCSCACGRQDQTLAGGRRPG